MTVSTCLVCVEMLASSEFSYNDAGLPPVHKSKCIGGVHNQRVGALCRNGMDTQCKKYLSQQAQSFPTLMVGYLQLIKDASCTNGGVNH